MTTTKERVAVVTGGRRGIGRGVCLRLAHDGCAVAILDTQDAAGTVAELKGLGARAAGYAADVSDAGQVKDAVERIAADFGRIDILVNCAGVFYPAPFWEASLNNLERTLDINLKGVFLVSQAVARHMRARRYGKIVNIVSNAAILGYRDMAPYIASKAGVAGLIMALAAELGPDNINVNGVSPGTVKAGETSAAYLTGDREALEIAVTPLRRLGTPEDIAALVAFLASDESSWITGQTITIDGGFSIVPA
jgi:3-oxoacyl-[acyl-carrier protein] reductase